ncbi:MAG TPA: MarC family protein [Bryobacteraceae bacterium]|nr:MarC family protein [Bryobacteraceae bacterium]
MIGALKELTANAFLVAGALFPIVNPLGTAPIFLILTRGLNDHGRARISRRIAINSLVVMVASLFVGTHILGFFGISLPVVQVGGGLVVISTAWALLSEPDDGEDVSQHVKQASGEESFMRLAFYPLTLPLTVGPGSISVAIAVGANHTNAATWRWPVITGLLIGAVLIAASVYLSYRFAERVAEAVGRNAMNVVVRLSSFILVCIGVQILWNGLSVLLRSALKQ